MTQSNDTTLGNPVVLDLPATLDAESAPALIAQMNRLPQTGEIRLNAAAVTAISPGYLQILVAAFKTFPQLSVSAASTEFGAAFAACGIAYPQTTAAPSPIDPASGGDGAHAGMAPELDPSREPSLELNPELIPQLGPETNPEPSPEALSAAEPEFLAKTILTIDDSRTMRDMLNMALSGAGFTVVQAVDGQDGLNALARQPVDLIITDINMPKLDGYGVIRAIRKDPAYNNTPILVLSTEGEQESKDIAKDAGATGWIVKPFDPDGLVNIVNSVCG